MKVIVFGATGSIGVHLVQQALDKGYGVTAFARDPAKVTLQHPGLRTVKGDVLSSSGLAAAINGHDAVLVAIGAGRKGNVRAPGTLNIIRAMKEAGVTRLICESTLGAGDSAGTLNFFWKYVMFGWLLKEAFADHQRQEEHVRTSGLGWTIVRPAAFTDGPLTANYRHGFASTERNLRLKISRADVAHFMLAQLDNDQYMRATPGLSY